MNHHTQKSDSGHTLLADSPDIESSKVCPPSTDTSGGVIYPNSSITDRSDGPLTVREAVARYLTLRVAEGMDEKGDTFSHQTKHLQKRLCAALGDMPLQAVRADHLRTWHAGLKDERNGRALEALTRRHHLISAKTFFFRCWREGWVDKDPTSPIVLPTIHEQDVTVIGVKEAFHFFKANREHRSIGRIALEAFGGIRYSTAGKLKAEDLRFDRQGINMPSRKHKSQRRRYRQGQPANMWEWAKHAPEESWQLELKHYREDKREMMVLGRLRPMVLKNDADRKKARGLKNIWRHSFASYYLAIKKDYGAVAYLMQHTHTTTTEIYEGVADEADGLLYFAITPASVLLTWEQFLASASQLPPSTT
jgi:site-specific recombinase XerD